MAGKSFVFRFADVEVREREFSLTKAGEALAVEPKAFRVLLILLRNPGKLIPKQELLDAVWGDAAVTENSLSRAVALLRKVLGDEARTPRFIETVATVGYRWVGRVEAVEDPTGAPTVIDPPVAARGGQTAGAGSATAPAVVVGAKTAVRSRWRWVIVVSIAVVALLAGGFWYLSRPMPAPRIAAYTQITHDGRTKGLAGTDGSRIYFTLFSPSASVQIGVNGGETAPVPISLPSMISGLMDISPDGSTALVSTIEEGHTGNPMWVAPVLGGAARRLADAVYGEFTQDGTSVIYSTPGGDICVIQTDGTRQRKLASVGSAAGWFSWSPDGKTIRFTKDSLLWEMSSDGSGLHRLLPDWQEQGFQCCGRWTPDGHLYLFGLQNPSSPGSEIWALEERHRPFRRTPSKPIRLTTGPMLWDRPIPSRDGKKIFAAGITLRGELSRVDPKAGGLQPFLGGISVEFVSFSPDGKSVAYVSFPEGTLWKADRDGSNRVQLSGPPNYPYNPRWSPDSRQILFLSDTLDHHPVAYLVSTEGGTPRKVLGDEAYTGDANWSPDGKRILLDWGGPNNQPEKRDLRVLDLDSRQVATIPGSTGMWSSRWSPDGRYIAALSYPQIQSARIFNFKTQQWAAMPTTGNITFPTFSRDSRYLYYFTRYGNNQGVFRIPVAGGKEERVADMTNWHLTGYVGFSMTLDPTDAPLVLRDVGSDDIYALTLEEK